MVSEAFIPPTFFGRVGADHAIYFALETLQIFVSTQKSIEFFKNNLSKTMKHNPIPHSIIKSISNIEYTA